MTLWIFLKWKQSILDLTWLKLRIISRILVWLFTIIVCLSPHKVINKSPSGNCGWATSSQFLTKVMKTFRGREEGLEAPYGKRIWGLQFSNLQWHKRTHTNIVLKINRCHVGRNVIIYSTLLFSLIFTLVCACSTNSEMLVYKKGDAGLNHFTRFAPAQIAVKSSWQFKLAERTKGLLLWFTFSTSITQQICLHHQSTFQLWSQKKHLDDKEPSQETAVDVSEICCNA